MPIFHRDSFPPGEAKGQLRELVPFNVLLYCVSFGSPARRPLQWPCKYIGTYHFIVGHSLSFAALSSSLKEGAKAAAPLGVQKGTAEAVPLWIIC